MPIDEAQGRTEGRTTRSWSRDLDLIFLLLSFQSAGTLHKPIQTSRKVRGPCALYCVKNAAARARGGAAATYRKTAHELSGVPRAISSARAQDAGWPTGNGKKRSNSQACYLAQLFLAAA